MVNGEGVACLFFTARIEQAPSERARTASKKNGQAAPLQEWEQGKDAQHGIEDERPG
jgi:hypothetical protein